LQQSDFLPHNYRRNCLVYTGTHDNDTTVGWWTNQRPGHSTRSEEEVRKEREFALKYLAADGREIHWTFIRAALSSVANLAVIPLQDILGLGSEARMNLPARPTGNWRWRYTSEMLTEAVQNRLKELTRTYGRG
jgi:4-alpha-glucanotransferase